MSNASTTSDELRISVPRSSCCATISAAADAATTTLCPFSLARYLPFPSAKSSGSHLPLDDDGVGSVRSCAYGRFGVTQLVTQPHWWTSIDDVLGHREQLNDEHSDDYLTLVLMVFGVAVSPTLGGALHRSGSYKLRTTCVIGDSLTALADDVTRV